MVALLADENCHPRLVASLRAEGLDVIFVLETSRGSPDDGILAAAAAANRVILTEDQDFGTLVFHEARQSRGVLLLRCHNLDPAFRSQRVLEALANFGDDLERLFVAIDDSDFRVRRLPTASP